MPLGASKIDSYVFAKDRFITPTLFSDDGINWYTTRKENDYDLSPKKIYYDAQNQRYLLPHYQSTDGIKWTPFNNQGKVPLIYGNNRYLTIALTTGYYSLDDAQSWLEMANNIYMIGKSGEVNLYFNGNKFLATNNNYSVIYNNLTYYLTSSDGNNWQQRNYPIQVSPQYYTAYQCTIKQLNNKFYCFANWNYPYTGLPNISAVSQSLDGINWNESQPLILNGESDFNQTSVVYVNNKFYADCSGKETPIKSIAGYKTCSSTDGVTWNLFGYTPYPILSSSTNQGMTQNLTYQYGKYFLFDRNGSIWYSTDNMQTWTQTVSGITVSNYNTFQNLTGLSFILGTNKNKTDSTTVNQLSIAYSTDNSTSFKMATVPTLNNPPRSIATSGKDYVVVGDAGTVLHSVDGKTWTQVNMNNITTSDLTTVRYINGTYYAVGDLGYVLTSTNGTTWNYSQVAANPRLMDIIYDNSKYFVVGYGGYIGYSANATNWIRATTPNKNQINALAFGAGRYVAVGNGGVLWSSTNGISWSEVASKNIL